MNDIKKILEERLGSGIHINRTQNGVSSTVFSVEYGDQTDYFRVGYDEQESYKLDVILFETLTDMGARVPQPVFFEEFNNTLKRSVLLTKAIPGEPVHGIDVDDSVLFGAGADLARLASIPAKGFGRISRRQGDREFVGENEDYCSLLKERLVSQSEILTKHGLLTSQQIENLYAILEKYRKHPEFAEGHLAHGDYSKHHIFCKDGKYTGMIDFGDLSSGSRLYDLATYKIYEDSGFEALLNGFKSIQSIPEDYEDIINFEIIFQVLMHTAWRLQGKERKEDFMDNLFLQIGQLIEKIK